MKYSVVCKFLALILCAAMLLTAVASGVAIFALNEAGLYQQSYYEAYDSYRGSVLQQAANGIAARYASMELGGFDRNIAAQYWGSDTWYMDQFSYGKMGYTLFDAAGEELEVYHQGAGLSSCETIIAIPDPQEYPRLETVSPLVQEQTVPDLTQGSSYITNQGSTTVYDAVPAGGAEVTGLTASYGDSSEGVASPEGLGTIFHNEAGFVEFRASMMQLLDMSRIGQLQSLRFENEQQGLLYEISDPEGVGDLMSEEDGLLVFVADMANPESGSNAAAEVSAEPEQPNSALVGTDVYAAPTQESEKLGSLTAEAAAEGYRQHEVDGEIWYLFSQGWVKPAPEEETQVADAAPESLSPENARMVLPAEVPVYAVPNEEQEPLSVLPAGTEITVFRGEHVGGTPWLLTPEGWLPAQQVLEQVSAASEPAEVKASVEPPEPTEASQPMEEETIPAIPAPASEEAAAATAVTEPVLEFDSEEAIRQAPRALLPNQRTLEYYDPDTDQHMVAVYTMEKVPEYTIEFHLAEGAFRDEYIWDALGLAYNFHNYLLPVLIGSILLFALLALYLICAAGRRPGTNVVMAGGLNRMSLDVWFVLLCIVLTGAAILAVEGGRYLLDGSMMVGMAFVSALAYGGCLAAVSFCFACAAQVKTPDGFWWKNSLCGHALQGMKVCWRWFGKALHWMAQILEGYVIPYTRRLLRALWKFTRTLCIITWDWMSKLRIWLGKQGRRLWAAALNFWQQLPMTWQWLLAGFAMIILLALTVSTPIAFWGICASIALILYAAHAFGILLGGVKRMNKGDLDNKVDDKLLIGCFREFAGELNGLADVAVVAAQKQLKSERMRTELITNVSHDIKTPLTSIISYVDLMKLPHSEDQQQAYLEVLSRQSQRLKKLVDDLMELSKASTGNMQVDIAVVDAVEAVNQALGEFSDKLEKADLIPVFRQNTKDIHMLADGRLTWRVLSNLLGNAVKYAQPGTRLYIDVSAVEDDVVISLKNISREELNVSAEELLERFVRGDVSRNTEGSGLGLNIAQSLMQLQRGNLQLLVDGDLFKVTLMFPRA